MQKVEVYELCKLVAPLYDLEPLLVLAVCEQESNYDHRAVRLENGFYRHYVRPKGWSLPTAVMMSASYGLMQTMGLILWEQGMFTSIEPEDVAETLALYEDDPKKQLEYGCAWLQRKVGGGKVADGLLKYNGGGNPEYPAEVMKRYARLWEEKL